MNGKARTFLRPPSQEIPPSCRFASNRTRGAARTSESMTPTGKSVRVRSLRRLNLDFADALRRRLEPARCPRQPCGSRATSPTYATQSSTGRRRSRRRGALLRRFPLRGLPLGGLARRLLRRGLRLRLCLLRHSALLANDDETGDATQKGIDLCDKRICTSQRTKFRIRDGARNEQRADVKRSPRVRRGSIVTIANDAPHFCDKLRAFAETRMGPGFWRASNFSVTRKEILCAS